jgi:hypothetical protein
MHMHAFSLERKIFLSALVALALFAGALFASTPKASASLSQCSANSVCIWQLSGWTGEFSRWPASSEGCHNHIFISTFRSGYNNTSLKVRFGTAGVIPPGEAFYATAGEPSYSGEICWPA